MISLPPRSGVLENRHCITIYFQKDRRRTPSLFTEWNSSPAYAIGNPFYPPLSRVQLHPAKVKKKRTFCVKEEVESISGPTPGKEGMPQAVPVWAKRSASSSLWLTTREMPEACMVTP